jgi:hypothetical protein
MLVGVLVAVVSALLVWRWIDHRAEVRVWHQLAGYQPDSPPRFSMDMVASLPGPAQRFFNYAILQGTPLYTVAEIDMHGILSLGTHAKPLRMSMAATQILACPHGFVWSLNASRGLLRVAGSDAFAENNSWSRFWLAFIGPVARAGANPDHLRSAFGRFTAEAVFWTPAALLPGECVSWNEVDDSTSRVTVSQQGLKQAIELTVDERGRPVKVVFQRWSNANAEKIFKLQPFGGYLSEFREFDGFRLPTLVEAGNFFETDDYFPFFKAQVTAIRFP